MRAGVVKGTPAGFGAVDEKARPERIALLFPIPNGFGRRIRFQGLASLSASPFFTNFRGKGLRPIGFHIQTGSNPQVLRYVF